jgi:hypothetical protein
MFCDICQTDVIVEQTYDNNGYKSDYNCKMMNYDVCPKCEEKIVQFLQLLVRR